MGQSSSSSHLLSQYKSQLIQESSQKDNRAYDLYHCLPSISASDAKSQQHGANLNSGNATTHSDFSTLFVYKVPSAPTSSANSASETHKHIKWCRSLRHPSIISYIESSLKSDTLSVTLHPQTPPTNVPPAFSQKSRTSQDTASNVSSQQSTEQYLMVKGALLPFPDTELTLRSSVQGKSADTTRLTTQNAFQQTFTHHDEMTLLTYELVQCLHWLNTHIDIIIRPEYFANMTLFYDASTRESRKRILLGNLAGFEKVFTNEEHEDSTPHTPTESRQDLRSFEAFIASLYQRTNMPYPPIIRELLTAPDASLSHILAHPYFTQNPFVHVMLFLDDLQTKKLSEKNLFFSQLFKTLRERIDYSLMKRRILPRLLQESFLIEPNSITFLQHLLTPHTSRKAHIGLLSLDDYKSMVVPFIQHQYSKDGAALRMRLLQTLPYYIGYCGTANLNTSTTPSPSHQSLTSPQPTSPSHQSAAVSSTYVADVLIPLISEGLPDTDTQMTQHSATALAECIRYLHSKSSIDAQKMKQTVEFVMQQLYKYAIGDSTVSIRSHSLLTMTELFGVPFVDNHMIYSAIREAVYDPVSSEIKIHVLNVILMHQNRFDAKFLLCCIFGMLSHLLLHSEREVRDKARQVLGSISSTINMDGADSFGMVTTANLAPYFLMQERGNEPTKRSKGGAQKFSPVVHRRVFKGHAPKMLIADTTSVLGASKDVSVAEEIAGRPLFVEQLGDADGAVVNVSSSKLERSRSNSSSSRRASSSTKQRPHPGTSTGTRIDARATSQRDQDTTDDDDAGWDEDFEDWQSSAKPVTTTQMLATKLDREETPTKVVAKSTKSNPPPATTAQPKSAPLPKATKSLKALKKVPHKAKLNREAEVQQDLISEDTAKSAPIVDENVIEENAGAWVDFDLDMGDDDDDGLEKDEQGNEE